MSKKHIKTHLNSFVSVFRSIPILFVLLSSPLIANAVYAPPAPSVGDHSSSERKIIEDTATTVAFSNSNIAFNKDDGNIYSVNRCIAKRSKANQRWYCVARGEGIFKENQARYILPEEYVKEKHGGELINYMIIPYGLTQGINSKHIQNKGVIIYKYKINEEIKDKPSTVQDFED